MFNKNNNRNFNKNNNTPTVRINDWIRCPSIVLIHNEINLGVKTPEEGRRIAREAGLDLVEVAPQNKPPVCRIMDYGKYKYEQSLKEKEAKKHQKSSAMKELRLSPVVGDNDLQVKLNQAKEFLQEGNRVCFRLKYSGRMNAHKDLGFEILNKVIKELAEFGDALSQPKLEGNNLHCIIDPKK